MTVAKTIVTTEITIAVGEGTALVRTPETLVLETGLQFKPGDKDKEDGS